MTRDEREERAAKARSSWQYRAIQATRSHTTITGCILLAALGKYPTRPPFFRENAVIDEYGLLYADLWVDANGGMWGNQFICTVTEYKDRFNRLADELKFTDEERGELFTALRQWIRLDRRPDSEKGL